MNPLTNEQLWRLAVRTLDDNLRHGRTVPSRSLYPHQWSWDAGFIAVGLAHYAPERAWSDLRALFSAQWADGRVPHIVFSRSDNERPYFPGAGFWRTTEVPGAPPQQPTSGIVQPPVHALAAWEIYRRAADTADREAAADQLRWFYPRLVAQQRYLSTRRNISGDGLACLVHPWESGQDNSPAWDDALSAVPVYPPLTRYRKDLAVAVASHRPTDADYARYILIAQRYRSHAYVDDGPGERYPFLVECPGFNAIMAAAEYALAEIAEAIGRDPVPHREQAAQLTQALVDRLYDPVTGMFHARDLYTGRLSPKRCIGGLLPLILPELPAEQVKHLLVEASSPRFGLGTEMTMPLPSYDRCAPDLEPERYWRGPVWVNMNWLLWRGLGQHGYPTLADALRRATIDLVRGGGCYEYFHPHTGAGIGTPEFSWTAALTLDLLAAHGTATA